MSFCDSFYIVKSMHFITMRGDPLDKEFLPPPSSALHSNIDHCHISTVINNRDYSSVGRRPHCVNAQIASQLRSSIPIRAPLYLTSDDIAPN